MSPKMALLPQNGTFPVPHDNPDALLSVSVTILFHAELSFDITPI